MIWFFHFWFLVNVFLLFRMLWLLRERRMLFELQNSPGTHLASQRKKVEALCAKTFFTLLLSITAYASVTLIITHMS